MEVCPSNCLINKNTLYITLDKTREQINDVTFWHHINAVICAEDLMHKDWRTATPSIIIHPSKIKFYFFFKEKEKSSLSFSPHHIHVMDKLKRAHHSHVLSLCFSILCLSLSLASGSNITFPPNCFGKVSIQITTQCRFIYFFSTLIS